MTTAIAVETANGVVLGVDSQMSALDDDGSLISMSTVPSAGKKIVQFDGFAIAVAGDARALNLLAYCFSPPFFKASPDRTATDRWMTTELIPALKETLEEHDYASGGLSSKPATQGSQFLVATQHYAYIVESDWGWAADRSGLYAIGTGASFAAAALHALTASKAPSIAAATKAVSESLRIAALLDPYTGGPFSVIRVGKD